MGWKRNPRSSWRRAASFTSPQSNPEPCAVLFDRDGTLIEDVPYSGDPDRVVPLAQARESLDRLRAAGLPVVVISNQSGIGRGMITAAQAESVNRRVEELLGPFDGLFYCPHAPQDDCECRKPKPKLILDAAEALSVPPACCVMVGDKVSDIEAASNAGAQGFLLGPSFGLRDAVDRILRV
ncbi:MAG: HAD family hydrolase [Candidatus Baltobacteraceae bacterium]